MTLCINLCSTLMLSEVKTKNHKPQTALSFLMILFVFMMTTDIFANPTGLIDNFALGISRSETPEQLKAERETQQDEPFFILKQSGNVIFQVNAQGNIEWTGILNHHSTTTMGNLLPVTEGIQLGSTESSWGKLYLNEMYFPLLDKEAKLLESDRVDITLNQLEVVHPEKQPTQIHLKLKSSETLSVKNPNQRSFYNVSHIIPIIIKRLQDDRSLIQAQSQQLEAHEKQNQAQELKISQLAQVYKEQQQKLDQSERSLNQVQNELQILKNQLKFLTNTIQSQKQTEAALPSPPEPEEVREDSP